MNRQKLPAFLEDTVNVFLKFFESLGFTFVGTVALVQSKGKNILFDSGTIGQMDTIIAALRQKACVEICDIDFVITSHPHADHFSNVNIVSDQVPSNFDYFLVKGTK